MPRRGRRGYPVAILIGLDKEGAHSWLVYSEAVKGNRIIARNGFNNYNFHEHVIILLRSLLQEGFTAVILVSGERAHITALKKHILRHHTWLTTKVSFNELSGEASTISEVTRLIRSNRLQENVAEASVAGASLRSDELERAVDSDLVLYTIEEIEDAIKSQRKIRTILITEIYDESHRTCKRYQSVTQRAKNTGTQVLILKHESSTGARVAQLGGLVAILV